MDGLGELDGVAEAERGPEGPVPTPGFMARRGVEAEGHARRVGEIGRRRPPLEPESDRAGAREKARDEIPRGGDVGARAGRDEGLGRGPDDVVQGEDAGRMFDVRRRREEAEAMGDLIVAQVEPEGPPVSELGPEALVGLPQVRRVDADKAAAFSQIQGQERDEEAAGDVAVLGELGGPGRLADGLDAGRDAALDHDRVVLLFVLRPDRERSQPDHQARQSDGTYSAFMANPRYLR